MYAGLTILHDLLPTAAVNVPLVLHEEYGKLQPFVRFVENIGEPYRQNYGHAISNQGGIVGGQRVELVHQVGGKGLMFVSNMRPLFTALVNGLAWAVSDSGGCNENIVNTALIVEEKSIASSLSRCTPDVHEPGHAVGVLDGAAREKGERQGHGQGQVIKGYISRLNRITASFYARGYGVDPI